MLAFAQPASAATLEEKSRQELQRTLEKIRASEAQSGKLKEQAGKLEKELSAVERNAVKLAIEVQRQERALSAREEKLAILEAQRREKTRALEARKAQLSRTLSAMIRLARVPREAVLARPGSLEKTMRTAEALGVMNDALRKEAEDISRQLAELERLKEELNERYRDAEEKRRALAHEQDVLEEKIAAGRKLRERLYREQRREGEAIAKLSRKSQSLQELLGSLEDARKVRESLRFAGKRHTPPRLEGTTKPKGTFRTPAQGKIVQGFGRSGNRGVTIATRPSAQVVSPEAGEVVFTGPFMDYGRMVIIRHGGEIHTLLAGLARIDVAPGDRVRAGAPLGRMGSKNTSNRLYLELRKQERPVDPGPWFTSFSSAKDD